MWSKLIIIVLVCLLIRNWIITAKLLDDDGFDGSHSNAKSEPSGPLFRPGQRITNAYEILEVPMFANDDEIRRGYRRQVRLHHPDKFRGRGMDAEAANEKFIRIKEAHRILTTKERCLHDLNLNGDAKRWKQCSDYWIIKNHKVDQEERQRKQEERQREQEERRRVREARLRRERERRERRNEQNDKNQAETSWLRNAIRDSLATSYEFLASLFRFIFRL